MLFCEGRKTEPVYFSALGRTWTGTMIEIETRPGVGVPITIAREAAEYSRQQRKRSRRSSFETEDRVWAVFDRDDHEKYKEAVKICEDNNVGVARSNPCFELWLILHETDFDRPDGRHAVQKELERLRGEYNRKQGTMPDCDEMVSRLLEAEERSERSERQLQLRERQGNPFGEPSTTVGKLTREIRMEDQRTRRRA